MSICRALSLAVTHPHILPPSPSIVLCPSVCLSLSRTLQSLLSPSFDQSICPFLSPFFMPSLVLSQSLSHSPSHCHLSSPFSSSSFLAYLPLSVNSLYAFLCPVPITSSSTLYRHFSSPHSPVSSICPFLSTIFTPSLVPSLSLRHPPFTVSFLLHTLLSRISVLFCQLSLRLPLSRPYHLPTHTLTQHFPVFVSGTFTFLFHATATPLSEHDIKPRVPKG